MRVIGWAVQRAGEPMVRTERERNPARHEVLVQVAGCGVCHTDLGFFYDDVPTRKPLPLILGHEVSGTVVEAGDLAREWLGRQVVVPATIPCGECEACLAGREQICPNQVFPGSDIDGGFASHLCVPARGLCPVPDLDDRSINPSGLKLPSLAVVADAVSTPYQAITRAAVGSGDVAVFVGAGGIGGFGVQLAAALGARVMAIDIDAGRLSLAAAHGADLTLNSGQMDFKTLRSEVRAYCAAHKIPSWRQKIFETSGTPQGQTTAFGLLGPGGYLAVVGFTPARVEVRLSNLMAFDATVQGNWGCLPQLYPAVLDLVLSGEVALEPFIEGRPMDTINQAFADIHQRRTTRRVILMPEL